MTRAQHYAQAERLIDKSQTVDMSDGYAQLVATQALVHATLATASFEDER